MKYIILALCLFTLTACASIIDPMPVPGVDIPLYTENDYIPDEDWDEVGDIATPAPAPTPVQINLASSVRYPVCPVNQIQEIDIWLVGDGIGMEGEPIEVCLGNRCQAQFTDYTGELHFTFEPKWEIGTVPYTVCWYDDCIVSSFLVVKGE